MEEIFFDSIYVLQSLKKGELQTGENLYNDLIKRKVEQLPGYKATLVKLETKNDLRHCLDEIIAKSRAGAERPYLHFELHGATTGLALTSGELITWLELYDYFLQINQALNNQLFVSLATCYGAYIINAIQHTKKSPFFAFVGPAKTVKVSTVEAGFFDYFETLFAEKNINLAVEALNATNPDLESSFICRTSEAIFDESCANYIRQFENKEFRRKKVAEYIDRARLDSQLRSKFTKQQMRLHFTNLLKSRFQKQNVALLKEHFLFKRDSVPGLTS